jgi:hypothetical protein
MISPPKMMDSRFETTACEISTPERCEIQPEARLRKIGNSTMKPAPRNEPRIEPTPPMITMNRILNERSRL